MNVGEVSAEVALRAECREDFKHQSGRLFDQLTYLRTTLYLLKEVGDFPIWVLSWDHQIFLRITASSFYDSVILAVTRLVADDSDDVVTLLRFRNAVGEMLVPEAASSFRERLKVTKFDTATRDLANRVRHLRNTRVAHSSAREIPSNVSIDELEQLVAAVEKLYEPLLFRASAWFLPIDYVAEVRAANAPVKTDIEEVLDGFARRSYTINMPERNRLAWPHHRDRMAPEKLATINRWRVRIGLAEA
jgi:hypothetical protein